MKPSSLALALNRAIDVKRPAMIWGPPGAGKSDVVAQVAAKRKAELRDVRLSLLDPVDLKGFPIADQANRVMDWLPASFLPPMKVKNRTNASHGVLFLDELVSAPPSVQAAAYQLILNRKIGDYMLPDNWAIIAAGNREGDRAIVHRMPSALANRFLHLDYDIDVDDWSMWALDNDIDADILAFMRFRSDLLHKFDAKDNPRAFPTPRTWAFVNDIIHSSLPPNVEFEMVKGTIGEGAAGEFLAFQRVVKNLPSVDTILLKPESTQVPEEPSQLYALSTSLAMKANVDVFERMAKYVHRMPAEFQVLFYRFAAKRDDAITNTKSFTDWAVKNSQLIG